MSTSFQITVKTLSGKSENIEVDSTMTVQKLKERITKVTEIPFDQQRLIFNGKELTDNERTLSDSNIQSGSTIHLILSLRG